MATGTYTYTGSVQSVDVSDYATVEARLYGAGGSTVSSTRAGGDGGYIDVEIDTQNISQLDLYVGQGGKEHTGGWGYHNGGDGAAGGSEAGAGGGSTEIRDSSGNLIAAADAGGGGFDYYNGSGYGGGGGGSGGQGGDANVDDPGDDAQGSGNGGDGGSGESGDQDGKPGGIRTGSAVTTVYSSSTGGGMSGGQPDGANGEIEIYEVSQPPGPVENATIDRVGLNEIDISWDEPTSGATPDHYRIQYSEDGGSWTDLTTTTNTTYTHSNRPNSTDYQYRIRAENSAGSGDWDETSTRTTGDTPGSFVVGNVTETTIDLSWTNPDGDWETIEVYRDTAAHSSITDYSLVHTESSGAWTDTGLTNGRTYHYRVVAVYHDSDSDPTGDESATTDLPSPILESITAGDRVVDLGVSVEDNNPDGGLDIRRGGGTIETITDLSTTSYTDSGLLDGKEYQYHLVRDTGDATASSGSLSDITDLPPVEGLQVISIDGRYVTLEATDPSNNASGYRLLLQRPNESSYSQDGSDYDPVAEGGLVTFDTTELLDGQQYDATVETYTADATAREDQ